MPSCNFIWFYQCLVWMVLLTQFQTTSYSCFLNPILLVKNFSQFIHLCFIYAFSFCFNIYIAIMTKKHFQCRYNMAPVDFLAFTNSNSNFPQRRLIVARFRLLLAKSHWEWIFPCVIFFLHWNIDSLLFFHISSTIDVCS